MGEKLIKPYEISVWEEQLTQIEGSNPAEYKFKENKLAVIGSNTMTGLNKIYNPVFTKKDNGEKSLSFSLKYKYFDPYIENEDVINPFAALLINERKVKLHYDNKWYEFIIKEHSESSDGLEWTYTCTDAFVLELSKSGYNITFDSELNNNQGTAKELATKTLENTDWRVGGTDGFKQLIAEPVYKATLVSTSGISFINTDTKGSRTFSNNTLIYLFYSYVKNESGKYIQFIIRDDNREYVIDDNNVVTDTNFRITSPSKLTYKNNGFYSGNTLIISIGDIETNFQVNRLAYNQLTTYDPVMERTVSRYKVSGGDMEIYKYTDYTYVTSNVVTNYITNGDNFNMLEDGSLQGWDPYTDRSNSNSTSLELFVKPDLATGKALANLNTLSEIEGFLKVQFSGARVTSSGKIYNTIYNSGIQDSASLLQFITKGQKFVFRWRAGQANAQGVIGSTTDLRLVVAKYTQDSASTNGYYNKHINTSDVILEFSGTPTQLNNYIEGGSIVTNGDGTQSYMIDGVAQVPSTKYIYKVGSTQYIWNGAQSKFTTSISGYRPYYYLTATASKAISNSVLSDPNTRIGIFIYSINSTNVTKPYYIQDIQLTQFMADPDDNTGTKPVIIGNVPTASSLEVNYYYVKPTSGMTADKVLLYSSLDSLKQDRNITAAVNELYDGNSEKNLSITASQSNCFNILQTIAETFECWIDLVVNHDNEGYITYTKDKPDKYVYLRQYAGKDNWAGFKYGINLDSIERTINSDEIVTKLIVDMCQSDAVEDGYVSIANADSNQSGESYILNFDYYYNQGLLNREEAEKDRLKFVSEVSKLNKQLKEKEKKRINLETALANLESQRNVYTELVTAAKDAKSEALDDFKSHSNMTYEAYQKVHTSRSTNNQLTEDETIYEILGRIYSNSSVINTYSGLLTNINKEYASTKLQLYGSENCRVQFWLTSDVNKQQHVIIEFSDYLAGVTFKLGNSYTDSTSISKKYFDITSNETTISFTQLPQGYSLYPSQNSYTITKNLKTVRIATASARFGITDEIKDIQEEKDGLINNFNNKYSRYIQEGTWNSTDYIDSELYYLDALQVSHTSAQPTVSYSIKVVEVSELEGFENYNFDVGDKTYVEDTEFFGWHIDNGGTAQNPVIVYRPAREEVIVSEIEWHLDEPENNTITVRNYKTRFEDLFQRVSAAVQTVQYNEATYAKISTLLDANGTINQNVLLESLSRIRGKQVSLTTDGSIQIHGDEILIQNLTNRSNLVILNSEGIRISSNGGLTWDTAIDGRGINIGTVYTGILNTDQVIIGNSRSPSFRWDKSGISAYKSDGVILDDEGQEIPAYDLKTFVRYDQYGLYGIKNNSTFKVQSLQDIRDNAHFAVTWDGFFIKNSYEGGGRVEITSDNDFRVLNDPYLQGNFQEKIKIGALEWGEGITSPDAEGATALPTLYGIRIKNDVGAEVMKTDDDGNITISGTINANAGIFDGLVQVGTGTPHINIDGINSLISTSNYQDGAGYGWMINADGDVVFNNITARGAIKTAVFEYAEIQAVGGIFIFRPSSTIKSAQVSGNDLILTVEKPVLFKDGQWCKISNYTNSGEATDPDITNILLNNGLTHVYRVSRTQGSNNIILVGAAAMVVGQDAVTTVEKLVGGALVDMGNKANGDGKVGTSNYGIGINSSDNTVNLPARAISLFETVVDETHEPKVTYKYRGILGTLPTLSTTDVSDTIYNQQMAGTQGIYTDNMYIGNAGQYIAFYEDEHGDKQLRIKANQIVYEVTDDQGQGTGVYHDINQIEAEGVPGADAVQVIIDSSAGNMFLRKNINTTLICNVYKGTTNITDQVIHFTWTKKDKDGNVDSSWVQPQGTTDRIVIGSADVASKAIFTCEVEF